jgi:hypothetical protein
MRHKNLVDAVRALGLLGTVTFTGCGGGGSGSGGGGNNNPPPTISSFTASPATVTDGSSAMLTAVFNNGTGSITPGNISATSGTAVSVTPHQCGWHSGNPDGNRNRSSRPDGGHG